jgi:ABC-type amino acid transport substrate-binding protein
MTLADARILARCGVSVLLFLWGVGALTVIAFGFAFPKSKTGSFFSTSLVDPPPSVDVVNLFIPSNLFHSLSGNLVPAVVLFCILFGVALLSIKNKQLLLDQLDVVAEGLRKMNGYAVKLTPIGLFSITASAAGTLTIQEFSRLQSYLITDTAASLLLTVLVLPMLISACTPFRYRDILSTSKNALLTAFITSSVFVVIPMLIDSINDLYDRQVQRDENLAGAPEFVVPLGYPFPDLGKVLSLLFIQFAAWFYSGSIPLESYLFTLPVGLVLCFGKLITAIPFLLESQQIPTDIFQLWLMAGVFSSRIGDLLGCSHLLAFTILTTSAMRGLLRIQWHKLMVMFVSTVIISALTIIGIRLFVGYTENGANKRDQVLSEMQMDTDRVNVKILKSAQPNPLPLKPGQSCLDRIKQLRVIRVGFNPDRLPFSYVNSKGQLVGFDVELVYRMALDLGASVEFVPYTQKQLVDHLDKDHFDIAVSGVAGTLERSENMLLSEPYLSVDLAFVVKDYRSREFKSLQRIRKLESFSVGIYDSHHSAARAEKYFPGIRIVELESERDFFEKEDLSLDALLTSAQGGSAWTLLFPDYTVVNPLEKKKSVPLVFPMQSGDTKMDSYLENWIELKELDGTIDELYDYWILGKKTRDKKPRWSLIRDVLHLVE